MKKPYKSVGELRHRVDLYKITTESDGQGSKETVEKEPFATVWGRLKKNAGGRSLEYGQIVNQSGYELVVRYKGILDNTIVAVINKRTYTINDVIDIDERGRYQVVDLNIKDGYN